MTEREKLPPCPFCGSEIRHVESLAKSFDPPRVYHEWHHVEDNAAVCYVRKQGKVVASADDNPTIKALELTRWSLRASPSAAEGGEVDWRKVCPGLEGIYETLCYDLSGSKVDAIMERIAHEFAALSARPATEVQTKTEVFCDALERIALLDEADGHELTVTHAFDAVAIACTALGNKHPSAIFAERNARIAMSAADQSGGE